ncbi:hypothetical protein CONCODRAFT_12157 [Conidiobolus coronatus NRRL 28638]|uniref:Galactose oxidase n=1 Tax=Conidiobolus coronatus (strain ATCC 28846 / CBS 209.66 / NRRL 28638) TaxID=796925 RepID=A0A137NTM9_CONC2|nr:hypothetical protein CONCODRAFT_12157 [Conidiobolus coronatus NRRL 28638]|eukprot:KXN66076.1 hypothetical protein CONCODRAFT_12157 [Conidiobolus coronatus NRRL 28638]
MIKVIILLILFIKSILSDVTKIERLISATIRDNKLIAIYQSLELDVVKVRVFELKDGAITDIFNSKKTYDLDRTDKDFTLVEIDTPDNFKENKNKLWVRFEYFGSVNNPAVSPFTNRVGYINLDDMSLKKDSSFIKFPTDESFPVKGYTINSVTNELGSALYIVGGEIYSIKDNSYSISNSFYKYNLTSKEWVNITYSAEHRLKPLIDHKSVVIDNRYLVILGGRRKNNYNPMSNYNDRDRAISEFNSLYNLTIFDSVTNIWENINIKADIFDTNIANIQFIGFLTAAYKDKIIVFGGYTAEEGSNMFRSNGYLGILDFKSKNWNWSPILNEDGSSYKPNSIGRNIQVVNDQLIICTDISEQESFIPIHVFDIPSHRIKSTLRLSNSPHDTGSIKGKNGAQYESKALPDYAIVLIAISCTVLLAALIYLLYRRRKMNSVSKNYKSKSNESILEIWANPDIDNTVVEFGRDGNLY